jgi:hypothetical protein
MRKITNMVTAAFEKGVSFKSGNDEVEVMNNISMMSYRGNRIAYKDLTTGSISITTCGWNTNTTRNRLNGITGVSVYTVKGNLMLNGNLWDGRTIVI